MTIPQDLHQKFIDSLLLSDAREKRCLGRLFATETYPEFDRWLDHEKNVASPVEVLLATIMFASFLVADIAGIVKKEGSGAEDAILKLVMEHMSGILKATEGKSNVQH